MPGQLATIANVPRERFSATKRSLESVLAHRPPGAELVYIDGGSPPLVRQYLEQQAVRRGFRLISTEKYVAPNVARNLAAGVVRTRYVAFVDNDVIVSPRWLERLVECAEATGASIIGPVCCEGEPAGTRVRSAGGIAAIEVSGGRRLLRREQACRGRPLAEVIPTLARRPVGQVELSAALVRMDFLTRCGGLDERLLSALDDTDLCLTARRHDARVYLEPTAVVTYVPPPPFDPSDLPYFEMRWSDAWNQATIERFRDKWGLEEGDAALAALSRRLAHHRRLKLEPYRRLLRLFGRGAARLVEDVLIAPLERAANRRKFPDPPFIRDERRRKAA
jgi:GT2 family glycosyltransferase